MYERLNSLCTRPLRCLFRFHVRNATFTFAAVAVLQVLQFLLSASVVMRRKQRLCDRKMSFWTVSCPCTGLSAFLLHVCADEVHHCTVATCQPVCFSGQAARYGNVHANPYDARTISHSPVENWVCPGRHLPFHMVSDWQTSSCT